MKEALGLVETRGLSTAVLVADTMVKTSNVNIIDIENTKGLGYMTIKISGNVGAVNAAVTAGRQIALENNAFVSAKVIPRPSNYIEGTFCQPKKEQTEPKNEDNPSENEVSEKTSDSKIVEVASSEPKIMEPENKVETKSQEIEQLKEVKEEKLLPKESEIKEEAIQTSIDISKETNKPIIEEEKKDEKKETPNTENTQSEEKKVRKNSRKKKEPKKDNEDKA
ncbi:BMC domain-containing protein [Clostridium intestinale]|uniref:Microcompartments protein n=1 Tax=Clostridium intestinale URNW TaxID=1294142 RepID=U2NSK5_9CLOT|nr:BMC domain-containing protein [Clostridium intestinale]ERK31851.1 microcompartments protein [Clostridium intestinale URNW]